MDRVFRLDEVCELNLISIVKQLRNLRILVDNFSSIKIRLIMIKTHHHHPEFLDEINDKILNLNQNIKTFENAILVKEAKAFDKATINNVIMSFGLN